MKWLSSMLLAALSSALWAPPASASLPSPEEMLARARQGRAAYIQVLGEVESYAPTMSTKAVLYPYVNALDELQVIGLPYELDTLGSGPLANLALALTRNAIRFVRLDEDSESQAQTILRWAPDDVRFDVAQAQRSFVIRAEGKVALFRWQIALGHILDQLVELRAAPYVMVGYEDLQTLVTARFTQILGTLSNAEVLRLLHAMRAPASFETFLIEVQRQVLASVDTAFINLTLAWTIAAAAELERLEPAVPLDVARLPGDLARYGMIKLLSLGSNPDPSQAKQLLDLMNENQIIDLGPALLQVTRTQIVMGQVEFLYQTLREVLRRYEEAGLTTEVEQLMPLVTRVTNLRLVDQVSFEGTYAVDVAGTPGVLTVAEMGDSNFILGLALRRNGVPVYYSLFNIAYNFRDETYEAHRFAVDDPRYVMPNQPDWWMKFNFTRVAGTLRIDGHFSDTRRILAIGGQRRAGYRWDWGTRNVEDVASLVGIYDAATREPEAHALVLSISQVGFKLAGVVSLDASTVRTPLVYGFYNQRRHIFAMTSAELPNGRWVQVRGAVVDGHVLAADYIVAGEGSHFRNLELVRTPAP